MLHAGDLLRVSAPGGRHLLLGASWYCLAGEGHLLGPGRAASLAIRRGCSARLSPASHTETFAVGTRCGFAPVGLAENLKQVWQGRVGTIGTA